MTGQVLWPALPETGAIVICISRHLTFLNSTKFQHVFVLDHISSAGCILTKENVAGNIILDKERIDGTEWRTARSGERFCIRVSGTATSGAYSVVEIVASPGDSSPLHIHAKEDEYVLVLEGTARIVLGEDTFEATVGQTIEMKRGIPHGWGNPTEKAIRLLITATPGGCEEALLIISKGGELDLPALAARFQVGLVGPPILG
jgi:quercetin dioxygenase-like cupin family protein